MRIGRWAQPDQVGSSFSTELLLAGTAIEKIAHEGDLPVARLHDQGEVDHLGVLAVFATYLKERKASGNGRLDRWRRVIELPNE
ncbi:hypothetical protein IVB33_30140 [Bradyrhizobium sp. 24]|nr:hypothetical protein [Bradyrhizobium sp. 24]